MSENEQLLYQHPFEGKENVSRKSSEKISQLQDNSRKILWRCVINLTNVIFGSGILGLPYALKEAGFFTGILLLIFVSILSDYSLRGLVEAGRDINQLDYEELSRKCFGNWGYYATLICIFLTDYGAMISYIVAIGDTTNKLLESYINTTKIYQSREFFVGIFSIFFILPLSLVRQIKHLSIVSTISVITTLCYTIFVAINSMLCYANFSQGENLSDMQVIIKVNTVWSSFATISFAYVCHDMSFQVYQTLDPPQTIARWNQVVHNSMGISFAAFLCMSVFGYVSFLEETEGNILNNFHSHDIIIIGVQIAMAFTLVTTYAANLYMCRYVIARLIGKQNSLELNATKHIWISLVLYFTTTFFGCFVRELNAIQSLVGSIPTMAIAFIIPAANILQARFIIHKRRWCSKSNAAAILLLIFGILAAIAAAVQSINQVILINQNATSR